MKLLLSATPQIGSYLIRAWTFGRFSHVDIFIDDETLLGAHLVGGIKKQLFRDRLKIASRIGVYEADLTRQQQRDVLRLARATEGLAYDYLAIFGFMLRKNWDSQRRWFCSEWVAWLFREAGYHLVAPDAKVKRISPRDIALSVALSQEVYEQGRNSVRSWARQQGWL